MDGTQLSQTTTHLLGQCLGNYQLVKLLGQGGFATVYQGKHRYLGTLAAIKVLDTQLAEYELQRFIDEACLTARLNHEHIIRVLDFGIEDDIPFLVIEYAPYSILGYLHPQGSRLPLATVVCYVQQVAAALQYIHDKGLIHQDVKPENMLLGEDQRVLLSDFGISIAAPKVYTSSNGEIVGTVSYMAPEQIRGKPSVASDQYALGIVAYEWLTGTLPFEGTQFEVAQQHLYDTPAPLRSIVPTLPHSVEEVVLRALEKIPEERFGSVLEFAEALEQAYRQSLVAPTSPRIKKREKQAHLRGTAGLLMATLVIGPALGILLRVFGLDLQLTWLCLTLCLLALPLLAMFVMHNQVAFLLVSGILAVAALIGLAYHSPPVFLWTYTIASLPSIVVTFNLGIQKGRSRSRKH